jgi:hypothetical protein
VDAFLNTVVGGLIVALVGSVVGFYFNKRREKEKQAFERQRDDERRLAERRVKALDEMRAQCQKVVGAYDDWIKSVMSLEPIPAPSRISEVLSPSESVLPVFDPRDVLSSVWSTVNMAQYERQYLGPKRAAVAKLTEQGHDSLQEMKILEGIYRAHRPFLEINTRNVFESFHKEFTNQHAILSNKLGNLLATLRGEDIKDIAEEAKKNLPEGERAYFQCHKCGTYPQN